MPGIRPDRSGPVCAVTAWRTSTRRVGGFGFSRGVAASPAGSVVVLSVVLAGAAASVSAIPVKIPATHPVRSLAMTDVHLSPSGPPDTILDPEPDDSLE